MGCCTGNEINKENLKISIEEKERILKIIIQIKYI